MARYEDDDDRVVIVERDSRNGLGMMLLGLAVGAGAALLLAPASGQDTRDRISREARRAGRKVKDMTDSLGEQVTERVGRTRSQFDEQVERARGAIGARVTSVGEAIEAGREAAEDSRDYLEMAVADAKRAYADSRRAYREARFARGRRPRAADKAALDADEAPDADHADGTETEG